MGTPEFALCSLKKLVQQQDFDVVAVITQPDKPQGRNMKVCSPPVKIFAEQHNLPVLQPQTLRDNDFAKQLRSYEADVYVVAAYGKIIPENILAIPRYGCINVHGSLLPKYRGAAPIQHAIMNGETQTGVTIMKMDKGMDTGDIISQVACEIHNDTYGELYDRLALIGADELVNVLMKLPNVQRIKQDDSLATYAPMIRKDVCEINWSMPTKTIVDMIRGLNPRPGAYTVLENKMIKIWKAEQAYDNSGLIIQTGDGKLRVLELQEQGKKKMSAEDYLRGHKGVV